jgi:RNA polymerase sigma-70 factor, ECF subfamily
MTPIGASVGSNTRAAQFEHILAEFQDRVYNQAYRMLGNREDAEETAQDVFIKIYRSLDEFRGESKLSTWIYRITANECISRLRKKQLDMTSLDMTVGEDDTTTFGELIPGDGEGADQIMEQTQTAEIVRSMVRKLPPDWAMAISLCHFDDRSYDEIADIMSIPKATVATYIFRGRKKLSSMLMSYQNDR